MVREKIVEEHAHELLKMFEGVVHYFLQKDSTSAGAIAIAAAVVSGAVSALVAAAEEKE